MKWLTIAEVKKAAKTSKRAAVASCKKHWKQNCMATEEEMRKRIACGFGPDSAKYCALCRRYNAVAEFTCEDCPLGPDTCCAEYDKAQEALYNWQRDRGPFANWQMEAKRMYERLCEL